MKFYISIILLLISSGSFFGQGNSKLNIGDPAPSIERLKVVQSPSNATINTENLRNKIVILEFWATWCAPCIPAIAQINQLANELKDKPVQFIAITNEDEAKITRFLKSTPIKGVVALDTDNSVFNAYRAVGVPHTVVIDQAGKIAAITGPKTLTAAALNDLLLGKPLSLPVKKNVPPNLEWDEATLTDGIEPLFQTIIKPSNTTRGGLVRKPGRITADGISLMAAVVQAYETPIFRIFFNFAEPKGNYKMSFIVPEDKEYLLNAAFQRALEMTFEMKVRREIRPMDVYVLKGTRGKKPNLPLSKAKESSTGFGAGLIKSQKQPIQKLVKDLENFLEKPIIDETGLKQEYDWEIPYDWGNMDTIINGVKEKLGLELIKATKPVEVLIFERESS